MKYIQNFLYGKGKKTRAAAHLKNRICQQSTIPSESMTAFRILINIVTTCRYDYGRMRRETT